MWVRSSCENSCDELHKLFSCLFPSISCLFFKGEHTLVRCPRVSEKGNKLLGSRKTIHHLNEHFVPD